MRRLLPLLLSAGLGLVLAGCALGPPQRGAVIPAEKRTIPWTGVVPACNDPAVISEIQNRFGIREWEFWQSSLRMVQADHVRSIGHRAWGATFIPRRYCQMRALFNDHRYRTVTYAIGEDLGPIGLGWGVDWCVAGLDRHNAYAPHCRAAGP